MSFRARDWREVATAYFGFTMGLVAGLVAGWIVWGVH